MYTVAMQCLEAALGLESTVGCVAGSRSFSGGRSVLGKKIGTNSSHRLEGPGLINLVVSREFHTGLARNAVQRRQAVPCSCFAKAQLLLVGKGGTKTAPWFSVTHRKFQKFAFDMEKSPRTEEGALAADCKAGQPSQGAVAAWTEA